MHRELTRELLHELMDALARTAPPAESFRVYIVGGGTAVLAGWRSSTIDADLYAEEEGIFRDIQAIKERLELNVEFARPEQFVPALSGTTERHIFIVRVKNTEFYHYDPYAQLLSKIVRGFRKDLLDAQSFLESGMVEAGRFLTLVSEIPRSAYARYPNLSRDSVLSAVEDFLVDFDGKGGGG